MSCGVEVIEYALAKQVPDMSRGCQIATNYGDIVLDPEDSQKLAVLVKKLLLAKLKRMSA